MKRFFAIALLVTAGAAATLAAQDAAKAATDAAIEKEILVIEHERDLARESGDLDKLNSILADDYMYVGVYGQLRTHENRISDYKAGVIKVFSVKKDNYEFRIHGDTVILTGRETSITEYKGKPNDKPRQFSDVYVKIDGKWRLVFHQATPIVPY